MKTPDPNTAFDDITAFIHHYIPRHPGDRPATIRSAPDAYYRQAAATLPRTPGGPRIYGLAVTLDETLPPGVWRILNTDGDLIRDCRSENDPNGGRR